MNGWFKMWRAKNFLIQDYLMISNEICFEGGVEETLRILVNKKVLSKDGEIYKEIENMIK